MRVVCRLGSMGSAWCVGPPHSVRRETDSSGIGQMDPAATRRVRVT